MNQSNFDNKPYWITILLIGSFITAFIFVMIFNENLLKDIAAIWGAWIGAAIGYFFGSRPTETILHSLIDIVEQRRKDLEEGKRKSSEDKNEIMKAVQDYEQQLTEASSEIQVLNTLYQRARQDIIEIITTYPDNLDKELLDRLRNEYLDNET